MTTTVGSFLYLLLVVGIVIGGFMVFGGVADLSPETAHERAISLCLENDDWAWEVCEAVANRSIPVRLVTTYPNWSAGELQKVADGKIWLGMSTEMVRESWGRPGDTDRFISTWGVSETWTYYGGWGSYRSIQWILNFDDGVLTSLSEF